MVVAGARRSRPSFGVDYGGTNDLFGVGPRVAESRVDCAGPIAGNGNRTRMSRHRLGKSGFTYEAGRTRKVLDIARCYDKIMTTYGEHSQGSARQITVLVLRLHSPDW